VALLAVAFCLRLLGLTGTLWLDEAGSIFQASAIHFWATARTDVHPPLYFILLRIGLKFTNSFATLRLFSVACGLALVAVGSACFRRIPTAALILTAFFAASPELVRHSRELRPYSLLFFLLGCALLLSIRIATGDATKKTRILLSLILALAASTYMGTFFFLFALAPLLAWPYLKLGLGPTLRSLALLAPPFLLLIYLEFAFLQRPANLPDGWWVPPATFSQIASSLAEASGALEFGQFAAAVYRHTKTGGVLICAAGIVSALFTLNAALVRRRGSSLAWLLLASAFVYLGSIVLYSHLFEPILIARTVVPGLFPFVAGIAVGVGTNPSRFRQTGAVICVFVLMLMASEPGVRGAFVKHEGLRGIAAAAQARYRTGDQLVLFKSMDYGLKAYWPDLEVTGPIIIDQAQPIEPQIKLIRLKLDESRLPRRVLLVLRRDYYTKIHGAEVSAVLNLLSSMGMEPVLVWEDAELNLYQAEFSTH
jgi:hypothetical protein